MSDNNQVAKQIKKEKEGEDKDEGDEEDKEDEEENEEDEDNFNISIERRRGEYPLRVIPKQEPKPKPKCGPKNVNYVKGDLMKMGIKMMIVMLTQNLNWEMKLTYQFMQN
jgi:hypothetical protein